jgi:VWFA-related protein
LFGQEATFSGGVSVVNVLASVRDKQGHVVSDLNKDDFALTENGVPQTIGYFSRQSDLPLTLGLLVDTSLSQRRVLEDEKSASHSFISRVLREDRDRTFLIHFDQDTELLQDFTSSRTVLDKALDKVQIAEVPRLVRRGPNGGAGGPPRPDNDRYPTAQGSAGRRNAGTVLYDAIYLAADDLLRHETGRKAIVVLTDGVDNGSKVSLHTAIEAAQRADLLVYSILFADEEGYAQQPFYGRGGRGGGHGRGGPVNMPRRAEHADGKKVLQQISKETGGGFFEVSKKQPIDDIYRRIEEELRNQYNIGYTPPKSGDSQYREISLTARRKDLIVQSREGYYPNKQ